MILLLPKDIRAFWVSSVGSKSQSPNGWGKGRDAPRGPCLGVLVDSPPATSGWMGAECLKHETWTHFQRDDWIYAGFALNEIHPLQNEITLFGRLNAYSRMILDDFRPKKNSDHRILLGNCFAKLAKMTKKTARNHSTTPTCSCLLARAFLPQPPFFTYPSFFEPSSLPFFCEVDVFRNFYWKLQEKKGCFIGNFQKMFQTFRSLLGLCQPGPIWIREMEGQASLKLESMRFHRKTYKKHKQWIWTHKTQM